MVAMSGCAKGAWSSKKIKKALFIMYNLSPRPWRMRYMIRNTVVCLVVILLTAGLLSGWLDEWLSVLGAGVVWLAIPPKQ